MKRPLIGQPPIELTRNSQPFLSPDPAMKALAYDAVIVGAGVAGLTLALRLPRSWRIALLTKGVLGESNTRYAQGGLSAAIGEDDSPELHEIDTLEAGAGLCDPAMVNKLVEGAPKAVDWLLEIGTNFDRSADGEILLGREAAHSRRRVLHAGGDATGWEIERALVESVRERDGIDIWEHAFAIDLVIEDGRCTGLIAELAPGTEPAFLRSLTVAIAAGGAGQLWATTSNPSGATADGLAMAIRAGAAIADVEFAQFHPTVLALRNSKPFLISEAVRGEGAYLRAKNGERFMLELHPLAELAPRDVVARGIQRQLTLDNEGYVHLDLRHLDPDAMHARFPTISEQLRLRGLDLARDLIPVAPAAHYFMGGIAAGSDGTTSLPGLIALGEAACTGVHGANRLASNSLLEGLVFGIEAADRLAALGNHRMNGHQRANPIEPGGDQPTTDSSEQRERIQRAMSRFVAVVRDADGLAAAADIVETAADELAQLPPSRSTWETRNMATAASAVIDAAALRHESRGAHYRTDFPESDPELAGWHLVFRNAWAYETLDEARSSAAVETVAR
jgi:L-aspartate oxidase